VIRLMVLGAILVAIALWTSLNIMAVALSFIGLFTVLTGFWLYRMSKKGRQDPAFSGWNVSGRGRRSGCSLMRSEQGRRGAERAQRPDYRTYPQIGSY